VAGEPTLLCSETTSRIGKTFSTVIITSIAYFIVWQSVSLAARVFLSTIKADTVGYFSFAQTYLRP
jgi:hypothetical protein